MARKSRFTFCTLILFAFAAVTSAQSFAADGSGLYMGNQNPIIQMIRGAQKTIDIEIYTMKDTQVLAALQDAVTRKVRVRIVQDPSPFGNECRIFEQAVPNEPSECQNLRNFYKQMVAHGAIYKPFNKAQLCGAQANGTSPPNCFEHGKMVITDQRYALVSTGNFDPSNLCHPTDPSSRCNRDYTYVTQDTQLIGALLKIFELDLVGRHYDVRTVVNGPLAQKMTVSPASMDPLVAFIRSAKSSLYIQNQYLNDPTLNEAILEAAKRGVKVYTQVSSACAFAKPSDHDRQQISEIYGKFEQAGVHSSFFTDNIRVTGQPGYLHAKIIVRDNNFAWVGSVNGSTMALTRNREFGFFINDQVSLRNLVGQFQKDFSDPNAENWHETLECAKDHAPSMFRAR